jgi:hypothetical protein
MINRAYSYYFKLKPPTRICLQAENKENKICMSVVAVKNSANKQNLHVQSISKWAPANIGPYS